MTLVRQPGTPAIDPPPVGRPSAQLPVNSPLHPSGPLKRHLVAKALELGFCLCQITAPVLPGKAGNRLGQWLEAGFGGSMVWMESTRERRSDPRKLWPEVASVIVLAMNYGPEGDALATLANKEAGNISIYSRNRDYHEVMKGKLKLLGQWLLSQRDGAGQLLKVFVDTAPVMEKPLASAAGLGWQGKHTNLVSRTHGSWLLLGSIFTTLLLEPDEIVRDACGTCQACLDACPTSAFPAPYLLDARRCISYLTIEYKGHIALEFRAAIGNRIYGCDDCLAVCPWNKFAGVAREQKLKARVELIAPSLNMLASLNETGFRKFFSGNPVKRIGHTRFLRNVMIAVGNSSDPKSKHLAYVQLTHASPLVRAMAVWALARLEGPSRLAGVAAQHMKKETDSAVLGEWKLALEAAA